MRPEIYILMAIKCIVILNRNKTFVLKIQIKELRRQQMRPEIHIFFNGPSFEIFYFTEICRKKPYYIFVFHTP